MVDNTSTNFPIDRMRAVDQETGQFSKEARTLLRTLWNRTGGGTGGDIAAVSAVANSALALAGTANTTALKKAANLSDVANVPFSRNNLGLGSVALGNTIPGWTNPTGTGSRASFDANASITASGTYNQTQVQALNDQLVAVQKALAQLILDAESAKVISN